MKFRIKSFQDGGQATPAPDTAQASAPEQGGAPAEGGGQDPLMQIAQMFSQALQSQDCAALSQGAQMFLQLISQAQGGGGEQGGAPGGAPSEQPVYMKKGGKFVLKGKKPLEKNTGKPETMVDKKGGKMGKKC